MLTRSHLKLICILITFLSGSLFAQNNFIIKQFNSTNGLPQNSINGMQMDENGFMWLATEGGIVRYDGTNFKIIREIQGKPIPSDRIKGMIKTTANEIFFYDIFGRVYQIKNSQIFLIDQGELILLRGEIPTTNSFKIIRNLIKNDKTNLLTKQYPMTVYTILKNRFVLRGNNCILVYKNSTLQSVIPIEKNKSYNGFSISNKLFYFDKNKNLYKLNTENKSIDNIILSGEIIKDPNYKLSEHFEKILWNSTNNFAFLKLGYTLYKLSIKNENEVTSELVTSQLPKNCIINEIFYNAINKTYYLGTDTRGLFGYKQKEISTLIYNQKNTSVSNSYYSQIPFGNNSILTYNNRLFSTNGVVSYGFTSKIMNSESMLVSKDKYIWYAIGNNIYKYDISNKFHTHIVSSGNGRITSFYESEDTIWVGSSKSVGFIYNNTYNHINTINIFKNENSTVYSIIKNIDNKIWIATCDGIFILSRNGNKPKPQIELKNYCVRNLFRYQDKIFIGTYGNGFLVYQKGKFTQMPLDINNCLKSVHSFIIDDSSYVWMSTNRGIFKTHISEINSFIQDTTKSVYYSYFGQEDGLNNIEFNGGCSPSSVKLNNGYFSFSSMEGLVWFKPLLLNDPLPNSEIFIDEIASDKSMIHFSTGISLPSDFNKFTISISSSYWGNNANLSYEYNLEGFSDNWYSIHKNNLTVVIPNLPSGNYVLHIRKKVGYGNKYITQKLLFHVQKRLYEEAWFIYLCLGLIILTISAIVRGFSFNVRKRNIQLENIIQSRISELMELNKELTSSEGKLKQSVDVKNMLISIISHDIITPLRFISITAKNAFKGNNMLNMDFIKDIQTTSDKLHHNAQNILNWIRYQNNLIRVNKESVALNPLIEEQLDLIAEMSIQKKNTLINDISYDDIIFTDSTILNIIVQNIFSNANKYCQNARIHISGENIGDKYHLHIEDNGPGISKENLVRIKEISAQISVEIISNRSGIGYIIIIELLELLNGKINIESEEGKGTKITLIL